MRRNKAEIYLHLVWTTHHRKRLLTGAIEREVYRVIQTEAEKLGCVVLAIGGMPDHVHLVVQIPTAVSVGKLAQQVKGGSSTMVNAYGLGEERFRWQQHYGVFSVSRSHLKRVIAYVRNQKQHHTRDTTWAALEEVDEEALPEAATP